MTERKVERILISNSRLVTTRGHMMKPKVLSEKDGRFFDKDFKVHQRLELVHLGWKLGMKPDPGLEGWGGWLLYRYKVK